jgi:hypothetical protein
MKIVYAGQLTSPYYVPTSLMRMRELQGLGHDVVPIDTTGYLRWGGRWIGGVTHRLKWGPPVWAMNRTVIATASRERPDVLWVDKGVWITRSTLRSARRAGVRAIVHYTPDPAFLGEASRHFTRAVPEYDLVVTTKAYEIEHYRRHGARDVQYQYPSYDRDVHGTVVPNAEERNRYSSDVVFVGMYTPGRLRYLLPLAGMGIHLAVWGPAWNRCTDPTIRPFIRGQSVAGRDYSLALGCARIGLGLLNHLWPDQSTTRTMEIPACGSLLLAPRTEEHRNLFSEGIEADYFSTEEELVRKVRYYLDHPGERDRVAAAGRVRCLTSGYSSFDRVRDIIDRVDRLLVGRPEGTE